MTRHVTTALVPAASILAAQTALADDLSETWPRDTGASNVTFSRWDYYKTIATISPEDAAKPLAESECPLVKKKRLGRPGQRSPAGFPFDIGPVPAL